MVFSSTLFLLLFLPLVLLFYFIVPQKFLFARNIILLCVSLFFYAWGESARVFILMASILINYVFGLYIKDKNNSNTNNSEFPKNAKLPLAHKSRHRLVLAAALFFNIALLGYFKYAGFFLQNANAVFKTDFSADIALPIGISFFTFQIISYLLDIYWGKVQPQKNIINWALYISFFPQLIAGPIIRYSDISERLNNRESTLDGFAGGLRKFIIGLSKKVLIANQAAVLADYAFLTEQPPFVLAWAGAFCYALQIYFDFSGYSDMAIGMGKMFGFEFPENFNYPYMSRCVQEFWRRWHISLSSWFRDYLYIPLGGSRKGTARTYINLIIVFTITGFWHGASWSFIVWGLYHGVFLLLERGVFGKIVKKLPHVFAWLYTAIIVLIGWVIFRAESMERAALYIKSMFNVKSGGLNITLANINILLLAAIIAGIIFSFPVLPFVQNKLREGRNRLDSRGKLISKLFLSWAGVTGCIFLLVLSLIFIAGTDFNPFLYFRF